MNSAHDNKTDITYHTFNDKDDSILTNLTCIELRKIARENRLKISGRKAELIKRITTHYVYSKQADKVQRIFRGYITRRSNKLSGPALHNRKICVNDTDFVTMENITDIEWYDFFSYKDKDGIIYGFSLLSFVRYVSNHNRNICNPYNRTSIEFNIVKNAVDLFRINKAIVGISKYNMTDVSISLPNPYINYNISYTYYHPHFRLGTHITASIRNLYNKIIEYRHLTLNQRIQNIFIEFDRLGNYTQSVWFTSLTSYCYPKFLRILKDIWRFRAGLTEYTKQKVCCIFDPFHMILTAETNLFSQNENENMRILLHIKLLCVTSMETLIYTGVDEEHCKLGSLYCLMALTKVSHSARITMPWLYDAY